ncbi:IucA/IucC family protein [Fictibacillus gelatini]|uniref:IucA/IucC family protein n=1 Tax=Fictibacillus gelatini TaxID=225985 RepID=UPI000412FDB6|nr:IucA/IucC family protein [Fictibacillus gelatini]
MIYTENNISPVREEDLYEEEWKTLEYIRNHKPELEQEYIMNIHKGRQGILQRLFQAMIRERVIEDERVIWQKGKISIQLSGRKTLEISVKRLHSLGRFDITGDAIVYGYESPILLAHPAQLLELFRQEGLLEGVMEKQYQRFKLEIQNGVANLTLALAGASHRKRELAALAEYKQIHTSLDWVFQQAKTKKDFSPLAFYEQWVVEGHPLHPGAKTKFGLDPADVIRYSPEWGALPEVALIAVAKGFCQTTSIDEQNVTTRLYEEYEGLQPVVEKTLRAQGLDDAQFELVPVHPWQFDHTLFNFYKEEIEKKQIVPIPDFRIPAQALVSFRSLAPLQDRGEKKHHIKTAVNVQTTSAVRTVSPQSVENGPILSKILASIQERENQFSGTLVVLQERAGIYFQPTNLELSEENRWILQANLASILRENPENYVKNEDEIPMPAAALLAESPISGKPIAVELIDKLADHYQLVDVEDAAVFFIERYANISLPGLIILMVRYGISLEAHMQNSVSVFRNGEPVRILIRDFGGVRILPERLKKNGFQAEFHPGSSTVTHNVDELRKIITYSVMQNHFAELITCLVRALDVNEEKLWRPIVSVCKDVFETLKKDPEIKEQAAADEQALFEPMIDLKALATMRLCGDVTAYSYMKVPNPMINREGETM